MGHENDNDIAKYLQLLDKEITERREIEPEAVIDPCEIMGLPNYDVESIASTIKHEFTMKKEAEGKAQNAVPTAAPEGHNWDPDAHSPADKKEAAAAELEIQQRLQSLRGDHRKN